MLIPLASHLADPGQRGKVIGNLYIGLLLGTLLARTISGEVSAHLGWRAMFWLACGMSLVLAAMLARALPPRQLCLIAAPPKCPWALQTGTKKMGRQDAKDAE